MTDALVTALLLFGYLAVITMLVSILLLIAIQVGWIEVVDE